MSTQPYSLSLAMAFICANEALVLFFFGNLMEGLIKIVRPLVVLASLFLFAGTAFAGDCDTVTLSIQTASGGATVAGSNGAFSISFGNVNGLGIGTPSSGVSVSTSATGAIYTTPITVTTTFNNCSGGLQRQTIEVYQAASTSSDSQSAAREGSSTASVISVPISQASATTIHSVSGDISNQTLTRFVGLFVTNANGANQVSGTLAPRLIYQVSVDDP